MGGFTIGTKTSLGLAVALTAALIPIPPASAGPPGTAPLVAEGGGTQDGWASAAITLQPGADLVVRNHAEGVDVPAQSTVALALPNGTIGLWHVATVTDPDGDAWSWTEPRQPLPETDGFGGSLGWSPDTDTFHSGVEWTYGGNVPVQLVVLTWSAGPMDSHGWELRGNGYEVESTLEGDRTLFATADDFTGELVDDRLHAGARHELTSHDRFFGSLSVFGDQVTCTQPGTPWQADLLLQQVGVEPPSGPEVPMTCARGSAGAIGWTGPHGSATYPVNFAGPHFFDGTPAGDYTFRIDAWARTHVPDDAHLIVGAADAQLAPFPAS